MDKYECKTCAAQLATGRPALSTHSDAALRGGILLPVSADPNPAAIPRRLLRDLYIVASTKRALEHGVCPDCGHALEVIDTWERAAS